MADEFAEHGARFVFVYTREAHPGEGYGHHTSFEQKRDYARAMADTCGIRRPMLVDDLEGTVHRAYGLLPNMTFLINAAGSIVYRANWTDPRTIRIALEQVLFERESRRAGARLTPYWMEWMPQRENDLEAFMEGLAATGPRSVEEFIEAAECSRGAAAATPMRRWWEKHRST